MQVTKLGLHDAEQPQNEMMPAEKDCRNDDFVAQFGYSPAQKVAAYGITEGSTIIIEPFILLVGNRFAQFKTNCRRDRVQTIGSDAEAITHETIIAVLRKIASGGVAAVLLCGKITEISRGESPTFKLVKDIVSEPRFAGQIFLKVEAEDPKSNVLGMLSPLTHSASSPAQSLLPRGP